MPGLPPLVCVGQVDEQVEIVGRDPRRRLALGESGEYLEALARRDEPLGPVVAHARQRIEAHVEAPAVVMAHRLPHHLAHHVVAEIRGQVADAQLARPARRRTRQRHAIHQRRGRVVGLREPQQHLRLDVEEQQQVEQLLERVGELGGVAGAKALLAQAVEVALQPGVVRRVLAGLERLHRERQRVRARRLEAAEVREPLVDAAGGEQRLAQVAVGRHVPRVAREHGAVGGDRRFDVAALLEQHGEVEVGVGEAGVEGERALVRPRRVRGGVQLLQRDSMVVVRLGVGRCQGERVPERVARSGAVVPCELELAAHAPQRQAARRSRQARVHQCEAAVDATAVPLEPCRRGARVDEVRRGAERPLEQRACRVGPALLPREPRGEVQRRRVLRLRGKQRVVRLRASSARPSRWASTARANVARARRRHRTHRSQARAFGGGRKCAGNARHGRLDAAVDERWRVRGHVDRRADDERRRAAHSNAPLDKPMPPRSSSRSGSLAAIASAAADSLPGATTRTTAPGSARAGRRVRPRATSVHRPQAATHGLGEQRRRARRRDRAGGSSTTTRSASPAVRAGQVAGAVAPVNATVACA